MLTRAERLWRAAHARSKKIFRYTMSRHLDGREFRGPFPRYGVSSGGPRCRAPSSPTAWRVPLLLAEPELGVGQEWSLAPDERGRPLLGDGGHRDRFSIVGASVARHIGTEHHLSHTEQTAVVLAANFLSFAIFWCSSFLLQQDVQDRRTRRDEEHSRPRSTPSDLTGCQSLGLVSP